MLPAASEPILCNLLIKVVQGEQAVEIQRNILAQDYLFNPAVAFDRLDSLRLRSLVPKNLTDFLSKTRSDLTERDLYLVIRQYSSANNGRLSFEDFLRLVLPSTNATLSELAATRRSLEFTYSQEYALLRLLEKEVDLQVQCEQLKQTLCSTEEFSVWKAFRSIDRLGLGLLTDRQFIDFARIHGHFFYPNDVDAWLRRVSTIDARDIEYKEFLDFLLPVYSEALARPQTEKQEDMEEQKTDTPVKQQESNDRQGTAKALFKEDCSELKELLLEQVRANVSMESLRQLLAVQLDFSEHKVFQFFTQDDRVSTPQFSQALQQLGVEHTSEDVGYVFRRYGFDEDGAAVLGIDSIRAMLFPATSKYAHKFETRTSQKLTARTLTYLGELLTTVLESERTCIELKKNLGTTTDLAALFSAIDQDGENILPQEELNTALKQVGIDATDKELQGLLLRFVRSPQGKLDAFQQECRCK